MTCIASLVAVASALLTESSHYRSSLSTPLPTAQSWTAEGMQTHVKFFDIIVEGFKSNPHQGDDRATVLAHDAASTNPSPEATNYARGFAQFFDFEYPAFAPALADKSDGDKFLWFMGAAGSSKAKELLNDAINIGEFQTATFAHPLFRFSSQQVSDPKMSLEAYIWLRNFEMLASPRRPTDSKVVRMNDFINFTRMDPEIFLKSDALRIFNVMYLKAHLTGDVVPNFALLDYNARDVLEELRAVRELARAS